MSFDTKSKSRRDPAEPLPVFRTSFDAYAVSLQRFGQLLTAAAVPFALSISSYFIPTVARGVEVPPALVLLVVFVANALCCTLFAVTWFRALLLGEPPRLWPRIAPRHLGFTLRLLPLLLLLGVCWMPLLMVVHSVVELGVVLVAPMNRAEPGFLGYLLIFLFFMAGLPLLGSYLAARCALVLPASALDARFGFRASWRATSENACRLIGACIAPPVGLIAILFVLFLGFYYSRNPIELLLWDLDIAILRLGNKELDGVRAFFLFLGVMAIAYGFAAIWSAVLSFVFRIYSGWAPIDAQRSDSFRGS